MLRHHSVPRQGQPGIVVSMADLHAGKVVSLDHPKGLASQWWVVTPPYRACSATTCSQVEGQKHATALESGFNT